MKALLEDCFRPYFQPILSLHDGRVLHYEELARMIYESGNVLLPGAFIDVADRFGLVGAIDRSMIEKVMRELSRLSARGEISFSINLSGRDIGDGDLLGFIKTKMNDGVRPSSLIFEITETAARRPREGKKIHAVLEGARVPPVTR